MEVLFKQIEKFVVSCEFNVFSIAYSSSVLSYKTAEQFYISKYHLYTPCIIVVAFMC